MLANRCVRWGPRLLGLAAWSCITAIAQSLASSQATAQPQRVEFQLNADVEVGATSSSADLPDRFIFVIDGSLSMYETDKGSTQKRWELVKQQLRRDIVALGMLGRSADVSVVKFGRDEEPSNVRRNRDGARYSINDTSTASDAAGQAVFKLGSADGKRTPLYASMLDAMDALDDDLKSGRFGGGTLIVYSDGKDSGGDEEKTISRSKALKKAHPTSGILMRSFGDEAKALAQRLENAGVVKAISDSNSLPTPPKITRLEFEGKALQQDAIASDRRYEFVVRREGIDDKVAADISVLLRIDDRDYPMTARRGAWSTEVDLKRSPQGKRATVIASIGSSATAEASVSFATLDIPSSSKDWGLPKCGGAWGIAVLKNTPISLTIRVPANETVTWVPEGGASLTGASVTLPGYPKPGINRIRVTSRTKDGEQTETLSVQVIDPALRVDGPKEVRAGERATFTVAKDSGALASGARSEDIRWYVNGEERDTKGAVLTEAFSQSGAARVEALVTVSACGKDFQARGSTTSKVSAIPSIQVLPATFVRGAGGEQSLAVIIDKPSQIASLLVTFGDEPATTWPVRCADQFRCEQLVEVPARLLARSGTIEVVVEPEVRSEAGIPDPAQSKAATKRAVLKVRDPNPSIQIDLPRPGTRLNSGREFELKASAVGDKADVDAVAKFRVEFSGGKVYDVPASSAAASVMYTPVLDQSSNGALEAKVTLLDAQGAPIGEPVSESFDLDLPELSVRLGVDKFEWVDADAKPSTTATILRDDKPIIKGDEAITEVRWHTNVSESVVSIRGDEASAEVTIHSVPPGPVKVWAKILRAGNWKELPPATLVVSTGSIQPRFEVTEADGSTFKVHSGGGVLRIRDRSSGPIATKRFVLVRGDGSQQPIPDSLEFDFVPATHLETVKVIGTYTSITGAEETTEFGFRARPARNMLLLVAAILLALALTAVHLKLSLGNEFIGAMATWSTDDMGTTSSMKMRVGWLTGTARCSIVSKRASIPLPMIYGQGEFGWLEELRRNRDCLEVGGNLPKPVLASRSGAAAFSESGRGGAVRKTTMMPVVAPGEPVYLSLHASPTYVFWGWVSSVIGIAAIWIAFTSLVWFGYL